MPSAPAAASDSADTQTRGSLLVIFLTVFIDLLGFGMVLPLLPIYASDFGLAEHGWQLGSLMASFSLMQFLFAPLWGRLSDRIGRRPVLMVGLFGSVAFYGLFGVASILESLPLLFVARIGAGIAGATISTAQAYIADTTTPQTRARGMAMIGAAFGLGFTFGPLLAWAALLSSGTSGDHAGHSPWPGFVAAGLSGVALLLAIFRLPESLRPGAAHVQLGLFSRKALVDALSTPTVLPLLVTSFISVVSFGGYETTIALLLKDEKRGFALTITQIPLFFAYIGVVLSLVQGGIVRRLSMRMPEVGMATIGAALTMLGFVLLAWASSLRSFWFLMIASGTEVAGFAFMTPSLQSLISRRSDPAKQGGILGVSQGTSALARIIGPLMAVPLFTNVSHTSPYFASIGLMVLGLAALLIGARGGRDFGTPAEVAPYE
jgi:DHA1 family tetracycline resistance protein-like MFS transporter